MKDMFVLKNSSDAGEISCLLWAAVTLCLGFAPLLFTFIWGNHDWMPLIKDSSLASGLIEGRFTQYILLNILLSGKSLPIINLLLGFTAYSAALVLLWKRFFKFALSRTAAVLLTTAVATLPYINEILYFQFIAFSLLTWPLVIVFALITAQKASQKNYALNTLTGAVLLFFAVGGYPASAGLYAVASCLWALKLIEKPLTFKQFIYKIFPFAFSFFSALFVVSLIYGYLQKNNLMIPLYNNKPAAPLEILTGIPSVLLTSIQSLVQPQPFFSLTFKIITSLIILLFIMNRLSTSRSLPMFALSLFFTVALLLAVKLPALFSQSGGDNYFAQYDPVGFMVRTDFYTMPCLILFSVFYLSRNTKPIIRNITYTLSGLLLIININANFNFCKTHMLGFSAENKLLQRTISRIRNRPEYDANRLYTIIQTGELPLRKRYYNQRQYEKYGYYILHTPYTRYWQPDEYYNFTLPAPSVTAGNSIDPQRLSTQAENFISSRMKPWPSADALYIEDDYIFLILTQDGKDILSRQFNTLQR